VQGNPAKPIKIGGGKSSEMQSDMEPGREEKLKKRATEKTELKGMLLVW